MGRRLSWAIRSEWKNMGSEMGALELRYLSSVGLLVRPGRWFTALEGGGGGVFI